MTFDEFPNDSLSPDLQQLVDNELDEGEKLQWVGQPIPRYFTMKTLPPVLFAIPWTAFAVFWMTAAARFKIPDFKGPESFFMLFGIPFVLVGLGMFSTPFWERCKMLRTVYAITNQRAILFEGTFFSTSITSYAPEELTTLQRRENKNGIGDILLAPLPAGVPRQMASMMPSAGFINIRNVKEVEKMLRNLAKTAKSDDV